MNAYDEVHSKEAAAIRPDGAHYRPGNNVGRGGDDTLFALVDGVVRFERKGRDKKQVSVYPKVVNE